MTNNISHETPGRLIWAVPFMFALLFGVSSECRGQTQPDDMNTTASTTTPKKKATVGPVFTNYRKVEIGMDASSVDDILGKPESEYPDRIFFEISNAEDVQIAIGPDKKVTAVVVSFAEGKGAPDFSTVFGEGVEPDRRPDGTIYKMVRYPDAGYWVSYYAAAGDKGNVTLMMRKF